MLKLRTLLLYDYLYLVIFFISLAISLAFLNFINHESFYKKPQNTITGTIIKIEKNDNKTTLVIKAKEKIIVTYYLEKDFKIGDIIKIEGQMEKPLSNTNFNLFNYKEYLKSKKIYWIFKADKIKKEGFRKKIKYEIKNYIINRIESIPKSKRILYAFIIGNKSLLDEDIKYSYTYNGISHLLAISGAHIAIIVLLLQFVFKKIKEEKRYIIIFLILFLYTFINDFSPSVTRAFVFFTLITINKFFNFNIKNINLLLTTAALLLFLNPFYIKSIGFQYSFVISGFLIYYNNKIKANDSYLKKALIISLLAFISSFPLSIFHFYKVNLFAIIYNLFFCPFVALILYPLTLLTFIIPELDYILNICLNFMENISLYLMRFKIGNLIMCKISFSVVFFYYISIMLFLKKKELLIIFFLIFYIHYNYNFLYKNPSLTMLDIGQGDSFLISSSKRKINILVDTGGNILNKNSNIARNITVPYLESLGIRKIDYLILTHGDYDHLGEAINLIENFEVKKIILNDFGNNLLEEKIINNYHEKISYFKEGYSIAYNEINLEFLSPYKNSNENDNSLVFLLKIYNYKTLFMGDASSKIEKQITTKYNLNNIDILKIGHHGSSTSSSEKFIEETKPLLALISVGRKNLFNHPSPKTIEILNKNKVKYYQTMTDGAVYIEYKKNKIYLQKCLKG